MNSSKKTEQFLRQYGTACMSQSLLQPMCEIYQNKKGFISYLEEHYYLGLKTPSLVLSKPICLPEQKEDLIQEFLENHKDASFVQVDEKMACLLKNKFNYLIAPLGVEHQIDLQSFQYNWRLRPNLVRYKNKFQKLGFNVNEVSFNKIYVNKCMDLSKKWLKVKRHSKEQSFLTRPLLYKAEKDVRVFVLEKEEELACFLTLDPMYKHGKIIGYMINHLRYNPNLPKGAIYALIAAIIDQLIDEKFNVLSLGLAPFNKNDQLETDLGYMSFILRYLYSQNTFFYNFKGLRKMKESFKATKVNSYIAFKSRWPIITCLKLYMAFLKGKNV